MRTTTVVMWLLCSGASYAAGRCIAVTGDAIVAADLAGAIPAFGALAGDLRLAHAPLAGAVRTFQIPELERLVARHGLSLAGPVAPVCVERATRSVTREEIEAAMRQAMMGELGGEIECRIEVREFPRHPVSVGTIEFRFAGLSRPTTPEGEVIWRGRVVYGSRQTAPIWARVRLSVKRRGVVAVEDLAAGQPIEAGQIALGEWEEFPAAMPVAVTIEEVAGQAPRRSIARGEPVQLAALNAPALVRSGETITVEVRSGGAALKLSAKAEASGREGDFVVLRNPESGRRFRARVDGPGRAVVEAWKN